MPETYQRRVIEHWEAMVRGSVQPRPEHDLTFTLDNLGRLTAHCTKGDWTREITRTPGEGNRDGGDNQPQQEPLELTSYHHWMHQLDVLAAR